MPISSMANDSIEILKQDGTKVPRLKAVVSPGKIFIESGMFTVDHGDLVQRRLSNGAIETYHVDDPLFYEGHGDTPPFYELLVTKLGLPEAKRAVQSITYNVTGPNARINQGSVDNSTNVVHIDNSVNGHLAELRRLIDVSDLTVAEKSSSHELVDGIEDQFKSGKPKKSMVTAMLNGLQHVANAASVIGAIAGAVGG